MKAAPPQMSIGKLANLTGVSTRTIRYYEEMGIIPSPPRAESGVRTYSEDYVFYVRAALALKELGFSLEEIALMTKVAFGRPMSARQRQQVGEVLATKLQTLEHRIETLSRLRSSLDRESNVDQAAKLLFDLLVVEEEHAAGAG